MADLERFVAATGELPRHNARLGPEQIVPCVARLAQFLRTQRKSRDRITSERLARLESLPGFSWDPLGDAWSANVTGFATFFQTHERFPSAHASDIHERGLGRWASSQRQLIRGIPGRNRPHAGARASS